MKPTTAQPRPPFTDADSAVQAVARQGHAVLAPAAMAAWVGTSLDALAALRPYWDDLPPDAYLRDGGRYRRRRHACCIVSGGRIEAVARRPHWQPLDYNALHGGIERWFEPVQPALLRTAAWQRLLIGLADVCSAVCGAVDRPAGADAQPWYVEAHPFRIDTTDGIGRPTPEGAHRDGVDFVAVALVDRHAVKGGETRVFDADGPRGIRFTMTEPWTLLLLDDARVIHETTPIQPLGDGLGHRDTLVLTFRRGGFQGPPPADPAQRAAD